jgi:hypothetical protein
MNKISSQNKPKVKLSWEMSKISKKGKNQNLNLEYGFTSNELINMEQSNRFQNKYT